MGNLLRIYRCSYQGWEAVVLSNGILELIITPQIGGRVIQLRLGGHDYFYVNPRHLGRVYSAAENNFEAGWKNYGGSKVWPAPQGWSRDVEWPGPPDPILDGGPYRCELLEEESDTVAVRLESLPDEYTGLTLARDIRLFRDSSIVQVRHTMRNTSARPVRWAIWQVTQVAADPNLSVHVPARRFRRMFGDQEYGSVECNAQLATWRLGYLNRVAKFAVEADQGWLATLNPPERVALAEAFRLFPGATYPDCAPLEFWVNGAGSYAILGNRIDTENDPNGCDPFVETEILSPMVELDPGQEYSFPTSWRPTAIDAEAIVGVNSCAAVGRQLAVTCQGADLRVTGSYGVFHAGNLELAALHWTGKTLGVYGAGEVSPLRACSVDLTIPGAAGLSRVSLRLRDKSGRLRGTVDHGHVR